MKTKKVRVGVYSSADLFVTRPEKQTNNYYRLCTVDAEKRWQESIFYF